ncbi:MAG TPA: antitoxin VapB family protein [Candidatus Thermoplasmatota archaeon]|nr:antitoxin VapB family protein [Candidatus Thermoplasmatota archaeon]
MKTVTFDDEAYELLRSAKLTPKESFSHVVKRTLGARASWDQSAGAWSDKTDAEVRRLRQASEETFGWTGKA